MRLASVAVASALLLTGCGAADTTAAADGAGPPPTLAPRALASSADDAPSGAAAVVPPPPPAAPDGGSGVVVGHVIGETITAHTEPDAASPVVAELANPTEVGGPLVFQLVENEVPSGPWTEVLLPVRPNGTTGFVPTDQLSLSRNPYRIEIDRADHRLRVYRDATLWLDTEVAIGTGDTPTPVGRFYIIELLQPPTAGGVYGPFAFGLSGFSETLTRFAGGDGVIGIHGTNDPESIGSDVSHGCVRLHNEVIIAMAGVIPLGTPVIIA
ncbi:MAG: L,D-transpeptidase [Actinomycetota bacterium]